MAIFRIMLLAAVPFIVAPLVSRQISIEPVKVGQIEVLTFKKTNETIVYKTETGTPEFLRGKTTLPDSENFAPNENAAIIQARQYLEV